MLRRIYRVFLRYAEQNLALAQPGCALVAADGADLGHVDSITRAHNRLVVTGWTCAARIGVQVNRTLVWTVPDQLRAGTADKGFMLDLPFETGPLTVHMEAPDQTVVLDGFSDADVRRGLWRLAPDYGRALKRAVPALYRWKRHGDLGAREAAKELLGLVPKSNATQLRSDLFDADPLPCPFVRVTIVLPVYDAFDVLSECLARVAAHSHLDWHLIAIDDASPDGRVWSMLQDWCATQPEGRVTLLRNTQNLGFVQTANRGLAHAQAQAPDVPVVLLNSDALVPQGWDSRLLAPLADAGVATVTPLSNDAEIFSVPAICQRSDLPQGAVDALDAVAARLNPRAGEVDAPTGVGFCMALGMRYLKAHPQFDTIFGRGYGEETDWCQRARAMGGRHVAAANLFVEHRGGVSFGSAAKQKLLMRNGAEISRRYPKYDAQVQRFIQDDPLGSVRLALALAWAGSQTEQTGQGDAVPVYLAHALGGGAETYLQGRLRARTQAGGCAVVLRVGLAQQWKIEVHTPLGATQGLTDNTALMQGLMGLLPSKHVIYSCGVGARDAVALPDVLLGLAAGPDDRIDVLFHDFLPVSPSYTLLNAAGHYTGVPVAGQPQGQHEGADPAHVYHGRAGQRATLAQWQTAWGRLIARAERCVVFSQDSRDVLIQAYPDAAQTCVIKPHAMPFAVPRIPRPPVEDLPVIGVLGNIGYQKGIAVLAEMTRAQARAPIARLVVIGHIDPAYTLAPPSVVHGSYEVRDLPGLVGRYGIQGWLIPSVWPETFSFTTHEALATGLPVASFDLGAQGHAISRAVAQGAAGGVVPLPQGTGFDGRALTGQIMQTLQMPPPTGETP